MRNAFNDTCTGDPVVQTALIFPKDKAEVDKHQYPQQRKNRSHGDYQDRYECPDEQQFPKARAVARLVVHDHETHCSFARGLASGPQQPAIQYEVCRYSAEDGVDRRLTDIRIILSVF